MNRLTNCLAAAALLLAGFAFSQEPVDFPAWQLVAADSGSPAQLYWQLPAGTDLTAITAITVSGATVTGFSVHPDRTIISVFVAEAAANPLVIDELLVEVGADQLAYPVPPTEVHWLDGGNGGGLLMRASQQVTGAQNAFAMLLENSSRTDIQLTGFRYAPAAVETGALLLATDFGSLDNLDGFALPWLPGSAASGFSEQSGFDAETWAGLPFVHFSFSQAGLVLEPGGQVILILAAPAFTAAELFSSRAMISFAPWLEYRQAGQEHTFHPFVQGPGF